MELKTSLALIFIGVIGLYVSLAGLVSPFQFSPFRFSLTGDNVTQNWDSLSPWLKSSYYSGTVLASGGQLSFRTGTGEPGMSLAYYSDYLGWSPINKLTVEINAKVASWASGALSFQVYYAPSCAIIAWGASYVENAISGGALRQFYPAVNNDWHVYTITIDLLAPEVCFFIDGAQVASWNQVLPYTSGSPVKQVVYGMNTPVSGGEALTDYLYIDAGIKKPTGAPTQDTGKLRIFASYDGKYIQVPVTVSGPEQKTGTTTTDANSPLAFDLKAGSYTVSGTYNQVSKSDTKSVVVGQSVDVTLNFGGADFPPLDGGGPWDPWDKFVKWVTDFIGNPTIKALGSVVSVVLIGVGGIGLIPSKKRESTPPPAPPPRPYYA